MVNWHLSKQSIRWPRKVITWSYRGLKFRAHWGQVFFKVDRWPSAGFFIGSRAYDQLTCCKQGRVVRKRVIDANPKLKFNRIIYCPWIQMSLFCILRLFKLKLKEKQNTEMLCYKTQIQICAYREVAWSGFEQLDPGALLLGLVKSIYIFTVFTLKSWLL